MTSARSQIPRLIILAYAVAPGPGGPEGHVNARFLCALAEHWSGPVTVITAGESPRTQEGVPLSSLPHWNFISLGEAGEKGRTMPLYSRFAAWGLKHIRDGRKGRGGLARLINRLTYWKMGEGMKMTAWRVAATRALRDELRPSEDALIYSRALPFVSIAAVAPLLRLRKFRWIVNINDPLPPDLWGGLYSTEEHTSRVMRRRLRAMLSRIDAFTFPCAQLREIQTRAFPEMERVPNLILPHITKVSGRSQAATLAGIGRELRIAFSGTMRKNRARAELREALRLFIERHPAVAERVSFSFHLARATSHAQSFIESLPVKVSVTVGLSDDALDEALAGADVLLDLESEPDKPLMLTKVANYVGLGKPIWALCEPRGNTWTIMEGAGWGYATPLNDVEAAVRSLKQIHDDWAAGSLQQRTPHAALVTRFTASRQIELFRELCDGISGAQELRLGPATRGLSKAQGLNDSSGVTGY